MKTVHAPPAPVKRTALADYAACLQTYAATFTTAHGAVNGTARELYTGGSLWLEWRAAGFYERHVLRRTDSRLRLTEAPHGPLA